MFLTVSVLFFTRFQRARWSQWRRSPRSRVPPHREVGWTAHLIPLTADGLIYASSTVMLDSARRRAPVPALAQWLLGLSIAATLAANVAYGLGHGLAGAAAVAAWPAVALVIENSECAHTWPRSPWDGAESPGRGPRPTRPDADVPPKRKAGHGRSPTRVDHVRKSVSEDRHAPYVHDRHRPDGRVFACCWWCAMSGADRVIRWSTALAVLGVALIAGVVSYEHASGLVRAHGEGGWTARLIPLTVDGLIYASSMVMLDSAQRGVPVPVLARWLLGLGIAATLAANVAHGLGHGPVGAAVAAWPAVALVGSYELLMMVIRSSYAASDGVADYERASDPLQEQAAEVFAEQLAADRVPSVRAIRASLHVGQPRAQRLRDYLAAGANRHRENLAA